MQSLYWMECLNKNRSDSQRVYILRLTKPETVRDEHRSVRGNVHVFKTNEIAGCPQRGCRQIPYRAFILIISLSIDANKAVSLTKRLCFYKTVCLIINNIYDMDFKLSARSLFSFFPGEEPLEKAC